MPASPSGFFSSQTRSRSGSSSSTWPFRSVSFSPARAKRTTIGAFEQAIVVGVQRLSLLEHHVVGDVDDGGDRADAAALEPLLHPCGRGRLRVDAFDRATDEARAAGLFLDAHFARGRCWSPAPPRFRAARASSRGRGDVAREADHRQAIRAIRRDLERDQRVVERERCAKIGADCGIRRQREEPGGVVGDAELLRRAQHSRRFDAAHRGLADREAAGKQRRRPARSGAFMPAAALGAPQTICSGAPPPASTVHTRSRSASGCGATLSMRPTTTPVNGGAARHGLLDLEPGHRQRVAQARRVERRIGQRAEPAFGELHGASTQS